MHERAQDDESPVSWAFHRGLCDGRVDLDQRHPQNGAGMDARNHVWAGVRGPENSYDFIRGKEVLPRTQAELMGCQTGWHVGVFRTCDDADGFARRGRGKTSPWTKTE
ncbi:hypothetical protein SAV14893_083380 [Streptomyces avermitilis]|uniref:Uncharacterized protein n=1 Tax=Streptomyces avermitilis TaxID=33903 RepID=A0A4D4MAP6_STRAX|nr:hypothetical protein SAV14893_083380 [Streptomyces avermitilis]GDY70673.1 hypothetical protein SAV31267_001580 [Streptomyces avermitilis]